MDWKAFFGKRKKSFWIRLCAETVLLLGAVACLWGSAVIRGTLDSMQTARRWQGESQQRFAQIGCFLSIDAPIGQDDVYSFRSTLEQKLREASLEAPEGGSLYADAYSGYATITVSSAHGSAQAKALGVGGNFFLFHPLRLLSGSYISEQDLMKDRVVLDEEMAWKLFGSNDLEGMEVTIGDKSFLVAGVVAREDDFASRKAYTDGAGLFLSYEALEALASPGILWYEVVLPNPIDGFAKQLVTESFPLGSGDVVDNSVRYTTESLLQVAGSLGLRSMRLNGVVYPYWENAVRYTEDLLALLLVLTILLAAWPAAAALVTAIRWLRRLWGSLRKRLPAWVEKKEEEQKEREYAARGGERG